MRTTERLAIIVAVPVAAAAGFLGHGLIDDDGATTTQPTPTVVVTADEPEATVACIEVDGLPIWPGIPVVDPRPICDGADNPLPINYTVIWSSGRWISLRMGLPYYNHVVVDLAQYGGVYDLTLNPPALYGDVNQSGEVTTIDLAKVQAKLGPIAEDPGRAICDLDRSGVVDETDEDLCRQAIDKRTF